MTSSIEIVGPLPQGFQFLHGTIHGRTNFVAFHKFQHGSTPSHQEGIPFFSKELLPGSMQNQFTDPSLFGTGKCNYTAMIGLDSTGAYHCIVEPIFNVPDNMYHLPGFISAIIQGIEVISDYIQRLSNRTPGSGYQINLHLFDFE